MRLNTYEEVNEPMEDKARIGTERKFVSHIDKIEKSLCYLSESVSRLRDAFRPVIRESEPVEESTNIKNPSSASCEFESFMEQIERTILQIAEDIHDITERSAV